MTLRKCAELPWSYILGVVVIILLIVNSYLWSWTHFFLLWGLYIRPEQAFSHETTFSLYTRSNKDSAQMFIPGDHALLNDSDFNFNNPTWIFSHGWLGRGNDKWSLPAKDTILKNFDANVILIDWSTIANESYIVSRLGVPVVAANLTQFISFLSESNYSTSNINLVGFSLGAHLVGIAAKPIEGGFLGNIIALDPPWILFDWDDLQGRLTDKDASYVEVIHASGWLAGYIRPIGQVDFYLNGGYIQPGCLFKKFECSHFRPYFAFVDSFNEKLAGSKCSNTLFALFDYCSDEETAIFGGALPKNVTPGIYYQKYTLSEHYKQIKYMKFI